MLNSGNATDTRTATWSDIPELKNGSGSYQVIDAWSGQDLGCIEKGHSVSLDSHDVSVLVVKGEC